MSDPVDTIAPWTIKSVPTATRDAVTLAARKEGLTVGQWLERRVREWTEAGSPVPLAAYPVSDVVNLADVAGRLAAAPDMPVIRTARSVVRAALLATRGHTGSQTRADRPRLGYSRGSQPEITT